MEIQSDALSVVIDDERAGVEVIDYAKDPDHEECEVHQDHIGLSLLDFEGGIALSISRKTAADVWAELGETLSVDAKAAALDRTQRRIEWVRAHDAADLDWADEHTLAIERSSDYEVSPLAPLMIAVLHQYRLLGRERASSDRVGISLYSTHFRAVVYPSAMVVVETDDGEVVKIDTTADPTAAQIQIHKLLCSCEHDEVHGDLS